MPGVLAAKNSPPEWLQEVVASGGTKLDHLGLDVALKDSVFFPWSGCNGEPVRRLAGYFHRFVYADEYWTLDSLAATPGFRGYDLLATRPSRACRRLLGCVRAGPLA